MNYNNRLLQKVINETEGIFSNIAENYPVMLNELESGMNKAAESIKTLSLIENPREGHSGDIQLDEYLDFCKTDSRQKLLAVNDFKKRNQQLLTELSAAMNDYKRSQMYIDEIRDISESLQIVSLNALCNAVKAGKGGEGFSVITENLKDVTVNTIEKTANLESKGEQVRASFKKFNIIEKEIDTRRQSMLDKLEERVLSGIDSYQSESETVNRLLGELSGDSGDIRRSILRIMEELQQQDIIRQTIDQVILSISELPDSCENSTVEPDWVENNRDKAIFSVRLIELSIVMIKEVVETLEATINIFTDNFKIARERLEYIQNEKDKAVRGFINNLEAFKEISGMGKEIDNDAGLFSEKRQGLISLIFVIISNVAGMADEYESFDKISGWLQNVAVLSRIELSRSLQLAGMRESVDDMSMLVDRIQKQISLGEKETAVFINKTGSIFEEYKAYAEEEMDFVTGFADAFIDRMRELSSVNNIFSNVLTNFDFFTAEFYELFDASEKDLDQLKEIEEDLNTVCNDLKCIEGKIKPVLEEMMNEKDIATWDISDDNMNSIIEKFTIYSHKRTAADFSGVDVEDSVLDAGEVTLF